MTPRRKRSETEAARLRRERDRWRGEAAWWKSRATMLEARLELQEVFSSDPAVVEELLARSAKLFGMPREGAKAGAEKKRDKAAAILAWLGDYREHHPNLSDRVAATAYLREHEDDWRDADEEERERRLANLIRRLSRARARRRKSGR